MTQAFNLSQLANRVNTSGQLDVSTGASGTLPIANGGTNNNALAVTAGGALYTDGSKIVNIGAGSTGQTIISNGSSAPTWGTISSGFGNLVVYTSSGSFDATTLGATKAMVTVIGGGGGGGASAAGVPPKSGGRGGVGGFVKALVSGLSGNITVTVGTGGGAGAAGQSSSFGAFASATGGGAGGNASTGNPGTAGATGADGTGASSGIVLREGAIDVSWEALGIAKPINTGGAVSYDVIGIYGAGQYGTGSAGSNFPTQNRSGGVGGVVIVEY
jgi:hypothetical protein